MVVIAFDIGRGTKCRTENSSNPMPAAAAAPWSQPTPIAVLIITEIDRVQTLLTLQAAPMGGACY